MTSPEASSKPPEKPDVSSAAKMPSDKGAPLKPEVPKALQKKLETKERNLRKLLDTLGAQKSLDEFRDAIQAKKIFEKAEKLLSEQVKIAQGESGGAVDPKKYADRKEKLLALQRELAPRLMNGVAGVSVSEEVAKFRRALTEEKPADELSPTKPAEQTVVSPHRSEERRVGKECRS